MAVQTQPRAAVVGAGLSGLTAAYRLAQAGWGVTVFEAAPVAGGRVRTERRDGYAIDTGATAVGSSYHAYNALAAELGLRIRPAAPFIGIRRDGRTHLLRLDRIARSGLTTRLLSPAAKLRAVRLAADVVSARLRGRLDYDDMRKAAPLDTESARAYALRALGAELDSYLCEPIVRTMLIADTDKVSKVELLSGIANIFTAQVHALAGGQGALTEALAARLDVRFGAPVREVRRDGQGVRVDGVAFDACVVACPLPAAAAICRDHQAALAPLGERLTYTQAITVAIGTTRPPDCPAFLVQFPSVENADIALIFLDHNKAADRAPAGHGLLGVCWETGAAARMMDASDEQIVEHTLRTVLGVWPELRGAIDITHVTRWPQALPFTAIGAYQDIGRFNAALDPRDPVQFAADYLSAAGQNTAVEFGSRAARNLVAATPQPMRYPT